MLTALEQALALASANWKLIVGVIELVILYTAWRFSWGAAVVDWAYLKAVGEGHAFPDVPPTERPGGDGRLENLRASLRELPVTLRVRLHRFRTSLRSFLRLS